MKEKLRLDIHLVELGLAESRHKAQGLIMTGDVLVNDKPIDKPGTLISPASDVRIRGKNLRFVSRGGDKLQSAIDHFSPKLENRICLDLGSSTGGFTDCLLQNGASKVYAVDVGTAQLHEKLRQDDRVEVSENTHAKDLVNLSFSPIPDFIVIDVSFISLAKVLSFACEVPSGSFEVLALVKPQFELEREQIGKGGVVRDSKLQRKAVEKVCNAATELGLNVVGDMACPILGEKKGNQEYFIFLERVE